MRITLTIEGGFAALPGLSKPVSVEVDALPAQLATRIGTLVSMALQQPATDHTPTPDGRTYTIDIETDDGHAHTLRFSDPVQDAVAHALIDFCTAHGRAQRGRPAHGS